MLVKPAANATADIGSVVWSMSVFARWTRRVGGGRGAGVTQEQSPQMAGGHPERVREVVHAPSVVEEALLDQPQRPRHARGGPPPRRRPGRRLRPAAQARTEPRALRGGRGREEHDVAG